METVKIQIDYTPAIDEIISQLKECNTEAKKASWNTIEIVITDDMTANELILMGMMIKSCEKSFNTKLL